MRDKRSKKIIVISILLGLFFIIVGLSYAWFLNHRGVATIAKVQSPGVIFISGGHGESTTAIDLSYTASDVDARGTVHVRNVICIGSDSPDYELEIAHTTNINGLSINLYPATEAATGGTNNVKYNYKGKDIYYNYDPATGYTTNTVNSRTLSSMACLNKDGDTASASGEYHNDTYGAEETRVQKNAEPLYWLVKKDNTSILKLNEKEKEFLTNVPDDFHYKYARFFVIEGVWNEKEKETDIVSILVNSVESQQ